MHISDGRDCPVRPDDELACLAYPTLTDLPERNVSRTMGHTPHKNARRHRKLWLLPLAVLTAAGLMIPLWQHMKPDPPVQTIPATTESALPVQTIPAATESPTVSMYPFPDLVLRNIDREGVSAYAFGTKIPKKDVTSITFLDSLERAPEDAIDVSQTGSGKVLLWKKGGHLSIAGDGEVYFPADSRQLFAAYGGLQLIDFHDAVDTSCVTDMEGMFSHCKSLPSLDVSGIDTGNVTDMNGMFNGCKGLVSLDLSGFDTGNVRNMSHMFHECSGLADLNLSGIDTGNAGNMSWMFSGCSRLTDLNLSGIDTGNVTDMSWMFNDCSGLTDLNLSGIDTGNVKDMGWMFNDCSGLTTLDLSGFDTGNVRGMNFMFSGCSSLTDLDVSGFDTGNVLHMNYMFSYCNGLTSLDLSSFDTGKAMNMDGMFQDCSPYLNLLTNDSKILSQNRERTAGPPKPVGETAIIRPDKPAGTTVIVRPVKPIG